VPDLKGGFLAANGNVRLKLRLLLAEILLVNLKVIV
jgi:hypothetical protein